MENSAKSKVKAQVFIEFSLAFICAIIFLFGVTQLMVWFGGNIVRRCRAYDDTRTKAGDGSTVLNAEVQNFYNQADNPLRIFQDPE